MRWIPIINITILFCLLLWQHCSHESEKRELVKASYQIGYFQAIHDLHFNKIENLEERAEQNAEELVKELYD